MALYVEERNLRVKQAQCVHNLHFDVDFRGEKLPGLDVFSVDGGLDAMKEALVVTH